MGKKHMLRSFGSRWACQLTFDLVETNMHIKNLRSQDFPVVQWLRLRAPDAEGLCVIPGQGTRSHMPQLREPACHSKDTAHPNK